MLEIVFYMTESFDEVNNKFIRKDKVVLHLEHSLVSVAKWESKYHKSFINTPEKTNEEVLEYIKFMTITQNVSDDVYKALARNHEAISKINNYINDPMTATTFTDRHKNNNQNGSKKNYVTNEQIYSAMARFQIPFSCEKWHLNRLLTLIRVRRIEEQGDGNKMSKRDLMSNQRAANMAARAKHRAKG